MVGMGRAEHTVTFSMLQLLMEEKRFLPSLYGSSQARRDLPRFVSLVETGRLDLNTMVVAPHQARRRQRRVPRR